MVSLPENFVVSKFSQYVGGFKHNRHQNTFNGSCPICREGSSWLKKKRCYYLPRKNIICCHNCGWYSAPFKWIKQVGNYTNTTELLKEIKNFSNEDVLEVKEQKTVKVNNQILPNDSINLFDKVEVKYWRTNNIVKLACKTIVDRRLNKAINRPDALCVSLTDAVHKNRLVIPFYDTDNQIKFYQSRKLIDSDYRPKYLSKVGAEKTLYGANKIDPSIDYVFITEGPIDAFFIRNGLAVAGITSSVSNFTESQESQLRELVLYKKIWILDNQNLDNTSKTKTKKLLEQGESVFIWPNTHYKDLNEMCIDKKLNEIEPSYIIENTFSNLRGLLKLTKN
jgi:hypothetical protein